MENNVTLLPGDCLVQLKNLSDSSVDSIVTDPPYGISFMGKKWDYDVPSVEIWKECLRVLKPGGHLLSFGGTRTYHRLAVNIEDAGFEIRDQIMWLHGQGFPKNHDVSKAIDKAAGAEREVIGKKDVGPDIRGNNFKNDTGERMIADITAPSTEAAKKYQGWGSALKPANEPIVVARKPLEKGLTLAANVLKYGTGALNIDVSRIGVGEVVPGGGKSKRGTENGMLYGNGTALENAQPHTQGRWPANILFDEEAASVLDEQSGTLKSGKLNQANIKADNKKYGQHDAYSNPKTFEADSGGASRFFYVTKASKRERGEGNSHPTVKPIKLMEYLIRLVTPVGGVVLDPFMGSGTTLVAAIKTEFGCIGIEREPQYVEIVQTRLNSMKEVKNEGQQDLPSNSNIE